MNLNTTIIENESIIRMSIFFGVLVIMGIWEIMSPRKVPTVSKVYRWINNLGLVFFNGFIVRLVFPVIATGMAVIAQQNDWGVFNNIEISPFIGGAIFIVLMDLIIYFQHIMTHAVPLFWRLHRVHHADLDYDTTTGARFHTIEILFSMCIKLVAIILLGPSVISVILFEIILNATAMFNHGNIRLPKSADKILRLFIVTPDMHRIHHSIEEDEANSNFGFNLSIWDRIFGTYRENARAGQENMVIGIKSIRDPKQTNKIIGMLLIPFRGKNNEYVINSKTKLNKS